MKTKHNKAIMGTLFLLSILFIFGCDALGGNLLVNSSEVVADLERLKLQDKFHEDRKSFYPGAPTEAVRVQAEQVLNTLIDTLISFGKPGPTEEQFWQVLEAAERAYAEMESEEMDRALSYMEDLMDVYSIQSSGGRLNQWRYGFDPS